MRLVDGLPWFSYPTTLQIADAIRSWQDRHALFAVQLSRLLPRHAFLKQSTYNGLGALHRFVTRRCEAFSNYSGIFINSRINCETDL